MGKQWIYILFLAVFLCFGPQPGFAQSETQPTRQGVVSQGLAEAETLISQGKYAEAYTLASTLLREAPDDDAVNLVYARTARMNNRPNQAIMAYETLLEKYPNEPTLNQEIAEVYMQLGDSEAAQRYLARDHSLGQAESQDLLARWEKRHDQLQVHGKLRAGVLFDSNANQGPASNQISLGNWMVDLYGAKERSTFGAYLGGQADIGYRMDKVSPWWVVGDAAFFLRGNENASLHDDTRSQYSQWWRGAGGVRHLSSDTLFDARLKGEVFDYEFYQHVWAVGPELTFAWAATPGFQLISRGGIDQRFYNQDDDRDGVYGYIGEYARFFFGEAQHEFMFGARYVGGAADRNDYSYNGWEGMAGFLFKLPYGFELTPSVSFTQEFYNGPATGLETKDRQDDRWRVGTGLTYRINEEWSIETSYYYTDNNSESNLYDYDRHMVTMGVAWSF